MIIIPTYNERKNIAAVIGRIRAALPGIPVLFVDDNSQDGTGSEIKKFQKTDPNIHLMTRPAKAGFASAYLDGFKFVLEKFNPPFIITMDADLSHPPEKLPELISIAKEGKVAIGSRYVKDGGVKNWDLRRRILSRFGNLYARLMTKLPIRDITAGFMAVPVELINKLNSDAIHNRGYAFLMELKFCFFALGAKFVEVPIIFEERKEGESKIAGSIITEGLKYPGLVFLQRQLDQNVYAWVVFVLSFFVYIISLPRTMYLGDSPEYITSAVSLGIPHPSGNPAYVMIAHLFSWLPFPPAFSVGLFSALCASLGLVVFYFLLSRLGHKQVAIAAALILAFSDIFWSQAIMAKVYAPMFLSLMLTFFLLVKYLEQPKSWHIPAGFFVFGLGIGIHQGLVLFAPLFLATFGIYCFRLYKEGTLHWPWLDLKPFFLACFLFLLGIATYSYLPIRAGMEPAYNFAEIFNLNSPANLNGFKDYVLRSEYQDFAQVFRWQDKQIFLSSFIFNLWNQFPYILPLALIGVVYLGLRQKKLFLFTSLIFLINILGIILLRSSDWNFENGFLYSFYYLPGYAMAAFWIGAGCVWLLSLIPQARIRVYLFLVLLLFPATLLNINYKANFLAGFTFSEDYISRMLMSLPPDSILLLSVNGAAVDTITFGLRYEQIVNQIRPDVTILNSSDFYTDGGRTLGSKYELNKPEKARLYLTEYALKKYPSRPIYTTYLADNLVPGWVSRSNGLVYALTEDRGLELEFLRIDYGKDLAVLESNLFGRDLLAHYFYAQAASCAEERDLQCAQENFIAGIKYDDQVPGIDQFSFIIHRDEIFMK